MTLILGEGERWQAWDKPGGIPVFPPHADPSGDCLLRRTGLDPTGWDPKFAGGLAHRLDTPTSGQVLSANELVTVIEDMMTSQGIRELFDELVMADADIAEGENQVLAEIEALLG